MASSRRKDDAVLVLRSRKGDREAFAQLVRRYENAAYATALSYVHNMDDAKDIVQDAFIIAYCKLAQLREPESFGSWFRAIVRARCLEWVRSQRTTAYSVGMAPSDLAEVSVRRYAAERRDLDLWDAVYALPEKYREIVLMYYLDDLSYEEIADFMGLPVTTVKGRLQQSRIKLREHLSPEERGELAMKRAKVGKEVEEAICKIGREEIHLTVPLGDTEHIVLFFGVDADVEICHTDGDELVLTGTKSSIGFFEEEARASAEKIQVLADQVESWLEVGPHPGEVFSGTWHDEEGHPVAHRIDTYRLLTYAKEALSERMTSFIPRELYPEISTDEEEMFQTVGRALEGKAIRVTVVREKMEDIVLPRDAYTEAVRRVFSPNWTSQDLLHGPIGRVDLVVAVPVSRTITVLSNGINVKHVRLRDLRSDVNLVHCYNVELSKVRGNVCLLNSSVKRAHGIRGRFLQSFYGYAGTDWSDHKFRRNISEGTLRDMAGEIRLDLAKVNLEVSDLRGKVHIRNRFGTTRFHLNSYEPGSKYRIESDSGEVLVFLKEDLIGKVNLTVNTLCGTINCDALKDLGDLHKANDLQLMTLSTITSREPVNVSRRQLDAELYIKTRDGDVTIEKTM